MFVLEHEGITLIPNLSRREEHERETIAFPVGHGVIGHMYPSFLDREGRPSAGREIGEAKPILRKAPNLRGEPIMGKEVRSRLGNPFAKRANATNGATSPL